MFTVSTRLRVAFAGLAAAAALASAAPAHAHKPDRCDIERFEARFRTIEERRGYEAAVKWWDRHWPAYHDRCLAA